MQINKLKNTKAGAAVTGLYNKMVSNPLAAQTALAITLACPIMASAAPGGGSTVGVMKSALDVVFTIFQYVGIFLLVLSTVNLINAIRQEDGDRQQKAIIGLVVSGVMIGLKLLVTPIVNGAGTDLQL